MNNVLAICFFLFALNTAVIHCSRWRLCEGNDTQCGTDSCCLRKRHRTICTPLGQKNDKCGGPSRCPCAPGLACEKRSSGWHRWGHRWWRRWWQRESLRCVIPTIFPTSSTPPEPSPSSTFLTTVSTEPSPDSTISTTVTTESSLDSTISTTVTAEPSPDSTISTTVTAEPSTDSTTPTTVTAEPSTDSTTTTSGPP